MNIAESSRPCAKTSVINVPISSEITAVNSGARRCRSESVSNAASLTTRRRSRMDPREISTPCGWNHSNALRFS